MRHLALRALRLLRRRLPAVRHKGGMSGVIEPSYRRIVRSTAYPPILYTSTPLYLYIPYPCNRPPVTPRVRTDASYGQIHYEKRSASDKNANAAKSEVDLFFPIYFYSIPLPYQTSRHSLSYHSLFMSRPDLCQFGFSRFSRLGLARAALMRHAPSALSAAERVHS